MLFNAIDTKVGPKFTGGPTLKIFCASIFCSNYCQISCFSSYIHYSCIQKITKPLSRSCKHPLLVTFLKFLKYGYFSFLFLLYVFIREFYSLRLTTQPFQLVVPLLFSCFLLFCFLLLLDPVHHKWGVALIEYFLLFFFLSKSVKEISS